MRRSTCVLVAVLVSVAVCTATSMAKQRRPDKEKHFASADIRIHIPKPKDMEGWKQTLLTQDQKEKERISLHLVLKKEGSTDPFDVIFSLQAFEPRLNMNFKDPETGATTTIPTSDVARLSEKMTDDLQKQFKSVKELKKLKKGTISKKGRIKGQTFAIMGMKGGMPQHYRFFAFTYQSKTYILRVIMTTTAYKHEAISKMVDEMISKMVTWKP